MGSLLFPLPVLAILLAACDALLVRLAQPWRGEDVRLFFQAYFLWACFGLLALVPAWLTLRAWDRLSVRESRASDARPWVVLLGWILIPVLAHSALDRHTSLVGFSGLLAARPWMELSGVVAAGLGGLGLVSRCLGGLPGLRTASIGTPLAIAAGLFLPLRPGPGSEAGSPERPNLLLLVWDTCRSDRLEAYGYGRETSPGLAELAEESLVFEDSLSVSSFTFTSHLSLLTGVHPTTHGAQLLDMRFDPARASSIAALLAEQGYRTGAFVGTDVLAGRTGMRAGFEVYDDAVDPAVCDTFAWRVVHDLQAFVADLVPGLRFDGRPHWFQDFQRPGGEVLDRALAWIRRDDPRPWFCFVNLYDVHWPYVPVGEGREKLVRSYGGPVDGFLFRSDAWQDGYRMQEADKCHVSDLYEAELFDLDRTVERFLAHLGLDQGGTAVLVTSDHGEGLGEEDTWNHDDVREPQVRVPLILRLPGANPEGRRVRAPASGVDVAPTLLSLAGVPIPDSMEGHDLSAPDLAPERERWIDDRDHLDPDDWRTALYRGSFKLVRLGASAEAPYELYDLSSDPVGTRDVQGAHPELFAELVRRMEERLGATRALELDPLAAAGSAAALQALGYAGE